MPKIIGNRNNVTKEEMSIKNSVLDYVRCKVTCEEYKREVNHKH